MTSAPAPIIRASIPAPIIWLYGVEGNYHDGTCRCVSHCLNCFEDLTSIRRTRARMIAEGVIGPNGPYTKADQVGRRARYCSPYCKGCAKRARAFLRALAQRSH